MSLPRCPAAIDPENLEQTFGHLIAYRAWDGRKLPFAKVALFAVVGFVVLMLFVPSFRQILTRLSTSSETLVVPSEEGEGIASGRQLEIVTLLGFDAIPAILDPKLVTASEAESDMDPDEQVLGLSINGEHRAYSIRLLSRHEIVNDVVGGVPVAVTW